MDYSLLTSKLSSKGIMSKFYTNWFRISCPEEITPA